VFAALSGKEPRERIRPGGLAQDLLTYTDEPGLGTGLIESR
jgi:hypothetical protein